MGMVSMLADLSMTSKMFTILFSALIDDIPHASAESWLAPSVSPPSVEMTPIDPPEPVVVPDPEVVLDVVAPVLVPVLPPAPGGNSLPALEPLHAATTTVDAAKSAHARPCVRSISFGMCLAVCIFSPRGEKSSAPARRARVAIFED
jgi:hypothetical protein